MDLPIQLLGHFLPIERLSTWWRIQGIGYKGILRRSVRLELEKAGELPLAGLGRVLVGGVMGVRKGRSGLDGAKCLCRLAGSDMRTGWCCCWPIVRTSPLPWGTSTTHSACMSLRTPSRHGVCSCRYARLPPSLSLRPPNLLPTCSETGAVSRLRLNHQSSSHLSVKIQGVKATVCLPPYTHASFSTPFFPTKSAVTPLLSPFLSPFLSSLQAKHCF